MSLGAPKCGHVLQMKYSAESRVGENQHMVKVGKDEGGSAAPFWIRHPAVLHRVSYSVATLVLIGQIVAIVLRGSDIQTLIAVLIAGVGVALSWWLPWPGLVVTSAASFAVTAVGQDPLSVWMMAVLVLFSVTFRGKRPLVATAVVVAFFLAAYMTVGSFQGGVVAGAAALFSAIAGGATGTALRIYRNHWLSLEQQSRAAAVARETETERRVTEERLRIARDLHDIIGHQVAMLSVHLGVAEIGLPDDAESSRRALISARESARAVVDETQRILAVLRRADAIADNEALRPTPSLSGLDELMASFESIGLDIHPAIDLPPTGIAPSIGVTLYRLVQEALTNAYRHGEGAATIELLERDGRICVTVENQIGHGRSRPDSGSGLGLVGMRERVESGGGQLAVAVVDGRFRVSAEFSMVPA
jgi:signal transduction histidine kinase